MSLLISHYNQIFTKQNQKQKRSSKRATSEGHFVSPNILVNCLIVDLKNYFKANTMIKNHDGIIFYSYFWPYPPPPGVLTIIRSPRPN